MISLTNDDGELVAADHIDHSLVVKERVWLGRHSILVISKAECSVCVFAIDPELTVSVQHQEMICANCQGLNIDIWEDLIGHTVPFVVIELDFHELVLAPHHH